jgi:hypothetical protein
LFKTIGDLPYKKNRKCRIFRFWKSFYDPFYFHILKFKPKEQIFNVNRFKVNQIKAIIGLVNLPGRDYSSEFLAPWSNSFYKFLLGRAKIDRLILASKQCIFPNLWIRVKLVTILKDLYNLLVFSVTWIF